MESTSFAKFGCALALFSLLPVVALADGQTTQVAITGDAAPDGNGSYSHLDLPSLNASGQASFAAFLTGTSGGFTDYSGIFRGAGSAVTQTVFDRLLIECCLDE